MGEAHGAQPQLLQAKKQKQHRTEALGLWASELGFQKRLRALLAGRQRLEHSCQRPARTIRRLHPAALNWLSAELASSTWRSSPQPDTLQREQACVQGGCLSGALASAPAAGRNSTGQGAPDRLQRRGVGQQQARQAGAAGQVQAGALGQGGRHRLHACRGKATRPGLWHPAHPPGTVALHACKTVTNDGWAAPGTRTFRVHLAAAKQVEHLQRRAVQLAGRQAQAAAVDGAQLAQAPARGEGREVQSAGTHPHAAGFTPQPLLWQVLSG